MVHFDRQEKQYLAYKGPVFILEWYFTEDGESPALEYYKNLDVQQRRKFLFLLKRMGDFGKISTSCACPESS